MPTAINPAAMSLAFPGGTKSRVNRAGERVRAGTATPDDLHVIDEWRAAHRAVLNTFKANLIQRGRGKGIIFAQRHKRKRTIFDKLQRFPGMNLSRMDDVAGCRLIFKNLKELYGLDKKHCTHFAAQCLMARRMVERGVRCVQIYSGGMDNQRSWDGHEDIVGNHRGFARETDQPIAGLLADLEQRGLLDETLVVWGGEFGRLPLSQKGKNPGRDHNPHAFTYWMAGGGVKGGVHHGATDDLGHKAVIDKVSVNDLHATMLHLLGFDHERLTYFNNGRNFRLTDVAGEVVRSVLG